MAKRKDIHAVALGRKGAKARMTEMTEEERREVARKAAAARWKGHVAKRPASSRRKKGESGTGLGALKCAKNESH